MDLTGSNSALTNVITPNDIETVAASPLFHSEWYLAQNPDVVASGMAPVEHYLLYGGQEERDPGPQFSSSEYLRGNPDVRGAGVNPLLHFIRFGQSEGRLISTLHSQWIAQNDLLDIVDRQAIQQHISELPFQPLLSICIPLCRNSPAYLRQTIESVKSQSYPHWQCCIAADNSQDSSITDLLRHAARNDRRFQIVFRTETGGLSAVSQSALAQLKGEFVCFLDAEDLLHENALYEVAVQLNSYPETDLIFSDFDCLDREGHRYKPYFKTGWNYDLMLGHNLVSPFAFYRQSLVDTLGGLRPGFEGSEEYDLALRFVDATTPARIRHIPAILYHQRQAAHRPAVTADSDKRASNACGSDSARALVDHLRRRAIPATVAVHPSLTDSHRVNYCLPEPAPLVTIGIIAAVDPEETARCLCEILLHSEYEPLEILLQTAPFAQESYPVLRNLERTGCVRVLREDPGTDLAEVKNRTVREARGEVVILVDAELRIAGPQWIPELVSHALRPDVGAVGPLIADSNGDLIGTGIVLGATSPAPVAKRGAQGYFGVFALTRDVSALRSACVAFRRSAYLAVQGYAQRGTLLESDIDFGGRLQNAGLRNVITPHCTLFCPRGAAAFPPGTGAAEGSGEDPFYNPNLSLEQLFSATSQPSRRAKPWSWFRKRLVAEAHRSKRLARVQPPTEAAMELSVGIAGTFDVENYGDLLFPLIAQAALERRISGIHVVPYSLNAKSAAEWPYAVESLSDLPAQISSLSAMLIGGGQIVRFDNSYPVPVAPAAHAPLDYWLKPAMLAALTGKPLIWNAVGVWTDSPPAGRHRELVAQVFDASYLIGVRDAASQKHLEGIAPNATTEILPDTAFSLSRLWPLEAESEDFKNWRVRSNVPGRYVVLQGSTAVAGGQERIQQLLGCLDSVTQVVLPVCRCHGDSAAHFAHWPQHLSRNTGWLAPLLIAEIIGRAECVFASGMHACITALAYGVPVARRNSSNDRKFEVLNEFEGVTDWNNREKLCQLLRRGRRIETRVRQHEEQLEHYWDEVAQVILNPPAAYLQASKASSLQWAASSLLS